MPTPSTAAKRPARSGSDLLRVALFSPAARRAWAGLLVLLLGVVLYGALAPRPQGPAFAWDKANHVAAFAALAFTGLIALRGQRWGLLWITLALLALGVGIEAAQAYVPGRSPEANDLLADAVGIVLGLATGALLMRLLERRRVRRVDRPARTPRAG